MNRDMLVWWVGLFGGVAAALAAQGDLFPVGWRPYVTMASVLVAAISGWMKTSPLPGAPKG